MKKLRGKNVLSAESPEGLYLAALALASNKEDANRAESLFMQSANMGYGPALTKIGCLLFGNARTRSDFVVATAYFQKAANAGERLGYYNLGLMKLGGYEGKRSIPLALEYFGISAAMGYLPADSRWRWLMALEGFLWQRGNVYTQRERIGH